MGGMQRPPMQSPYGNWAMPQGGMGGGFQPAQGGYGGGFNPRMSQAYGNTYTRSDQQQNAMSEPPPPAPPQSGYQPIGAANPYPSINWGNWQPSEGDFRSHIYRLLENFGQEGYFDPRGNQRLIEAGRQNAGNISGGLQRQAQLASQASGQDPTQRASFWLQALLGGQGQQANLTNQALMDAWRRQADFAQGLMGQSQGLGQFNRQQEGPSFGDYLGALGGTAVGSFLGPLGGAAGGALGRRLF
jgi:hypothetical protein